MRYLVFGGCGFVGSNLSAEVLKRNGELILFDNLQRYGSYSNLQWLQSMGEFRFIHGDIRNSNDVEQVVRENRPDVIFHVAAQVAMTTSIENPRADFETNALGTFNILEAVRIHSPESVILFSCTNKVYGDLQLLHYKETPTRYVCEEYPEGFDETLPLDFSSPYGCSKGVADQYMIDYNRMFGIRTAVFRHSSMYGDRQWATYDQGWISWFCVKAVEVKRGILKEPLTISGDGKQVRDILDASDIVKLYFKAVDNIERAKGQAFNVGGGFKNSLSLLELFDILEKQLDIKLAYTKLDWRPVDQKVFIADVNKANKMIGWQPELDKIEGIRNMLAWLRDNWKF
jgi:CDP-paratose 2-epimerase